PKPSFTNPPLLRTSSSSRARPPYPPSPPPEHPEPPPRPTRKPDPAVRLGLARVARENPRSQSSHRKARSRALDGGPRERAVARRRERQALAPRAHAGRP